MARPGEAGELVSPALILVLLVSCSFGSSPTCPSEHTSMEGQRAKGHELLQSAIREGVAEDAATARACFQAALIQVRPGDAQNRGELMVAVADALETVGNVEGSAAQLREVLREFPTSPVPHFKLGNQARDSERWDDAVHHYTEAVRLAPNFVNARTNLGMVLRTLDQLDSAIAQYREALRLSPGRADVHVNHGVALDAAGYPEEAQGAYSNAIRLDPGLYQAYFNLGVVKSETLKDREAGLALYFQSLEIAPSFPDAYHTIGTTYTALGRYADARRFLDSALALRPADSRFHNSVGILLDAMGDAQGALEAYRASVQQNPSAAAIINAAKVLNSRSRFREAEQVLPPPPPPLLPRTNRTSLVPPLVLSGHAASLTPYREAVQVLSPAARSFTGESCPELPRGP